MNVYTTTIIGTGRLGGALALALENKRYEIRQFVTRDRIKAERIASYLKKRPEILDADELHKVSSDIVFITTQDSQIAPVAEKLAERLDHLPYVYHTSGAVSSSVLRCLSDEGCEVASFHPLISLSDIESSSQNFKGSYVCLEGDSRAVAIGTKIADDLEAHHFSINAADKPLYHASAVMACGHLVALLSTSIDMLSKCGIEKFRAQEILLPLVQSTINNLSIQTPAEALTGPFARADLETIKTHLKTINERATPEMLEVYLILGKASLELAAECGADEGRLNEISKEIVSAQKEIN